MEFIVHTYAMSEVENESDMECSDSDCGDAGYEDYYSAQPWDGENDNDIESERHGKDPEHSVYECLRVDEVERLLNENVEYLSTTLSTTPSMAKLYLHAYKWAIQEIISRYQNKTLDITMHQRIQVSELIGSSCTPKCLKENVCLVCYSSLSKEKFSTLTCKHSFCKDCWCMHFETQILQGISTGKRIFTSVFCLSCCYVYK